MNDPKHSTDDIMQIDALEAALDHCAKRAMAAFAVNEPELADEVLAQFVAGTVCFSTTVMNWNASTRRPARISVTAHFAAGDREPQPIASMLLTEMAMN